MLWNAEVNRPVFVMCLIQWGLFRIRSWSGAVMRSPWFLPGSSRAMWNFSIHLVSLVLCSEAVIPSVWASWEFWGGVVLSCYLYLACLTAAIRHAQSAFPSSSPAITTRQQKANCYIWHYTYRIHRNSVFRHRNLVLALINFHELLQNNSSQC